MKRKIFFIVFLFFSTLTYGQLKKDTLGLKKQALESLDIKETVSLINLIANPKKYEGKRIAIVGYMHLEFEGDAIYLHKEDYENSLSKNAFEIIFSQKLTKFKNPKDYNNKYMLLIGKYSSKDMETQTIKAVGNTGLYAGHLTNIVWLETWGAWKN